MPNYSPFPMKDRRLGLNLVKREDDLYPGELTVAENVDLSRESWAKRKGHRNAFTGRLDNVLKGGPASLSLEMKGEEWWIEHPNGLEGMLGSKGDSNVTGFPTYGRRDFYHHRQGVILIPEDNNIGERLEVSSGPPTQINWCIEFSLFTDDLPLLRGFFTGTPLPWSIVVASKGTGTHAIGTPSTQWALRLIPDPGGLSPNRFMVALTLYETSDASLAVNFYYQTPAGERAWIDPGKRTWVAFEFQNGGSPKIKSYYWRQGTVTQSNVPNYSYQDFLGARPGGSTGSPEGGANLRTNGVLGGAYPICIGRRPLLYNHDVAVGAEPTTREMGFNGCVTDMRFWWPLVGGVPANLELPPNFGIVATDPPTPPVR